jgi:CHAT domain-containing protein
LLAERFWDPLDIRDDHVIVVPHGPLHSLPFHALRPAGGGQVIDRHLLTYLPSASAGRYLGREHRRGRPSTAEPALLAVGVADETIPHVDDELRAIRSIYSRGSTLTGAEANRRRFVDAAATSDIIHIAAHGLFREDDPHFSALRLADGWMSLYDLYGLRTRAELVCISACQSGRSWVGDGDELVGLVRGFLHAGAAALVVSLWPVQDASTAQLMSSFYDRLRNGTGRAAALREAMLELRANHPHPYHWAPFVLIG